MATYGGDEPVLMGGGAVRQAKAAEGRLTVVDTLALEPAKTVGVLAAWLLPSPAY